MGCVESKKPIVPVYVKTNTNTFCQSNINNGTNNSAILKQNNEPFVLGNVSTKNLNTKPSLPVKLTEISGKIKIKNIISKNENKAEENYKVISKVGKGSFGSVYKVVDNQTGIIRAMKVIKKETIAYQDDEKVFLKEIEILTKLEHPNIIKIIEYFADEINFYVITEFVSGGELYESITKFHHFNEVKAAYIMKQILCALNYLHSFGIVHRDIKPENMLVEPNSSNENINIKLIDFGTCNYIKDNKNLTLKVGSPYYIAPEVLNKNYNKKCDIWSAGVILYILLLGYPPFKGKSAQELFSRINKGTYRKEGKEWDNISDNAKDLILKMLEYDPQKRLSAQECLEHPWIVSLLGDNSNLTSTQMDLLPNVLENIYNFNAKEKLQQATIAYIVHSLYSSQEIGALKKVFQALDVNGDGMLTYRELKEGFEKYFGKSISEMKINKIIEEIDSNSDGIISYEEFLRVSVNQKTILDEKNLRLAFDRFDLNKDGKLSKEELRVVLGTSEFDYINTLLRLIDENKDGFLSFEEFKRLMKGVILPNRNDTHFCFEKKLSSSEISEEDNK